MHELINLAKKKQMIDVCIPFLRRFKITDSYPTIKCTEKTTSVDNQHLVPIKKLRKVPNGNRL
jgi:hypothetical protein